MAVAASSYAAQDQQLSALQAQLKDLAAKKQALVTQVKNKQTEILEQDRALEQLARQLNYSFVDKFKPLRSDAPPQLRQVQQRLIQLNNELKTLQQELSRTDSEIKSVVQQIEQRQKLLSAEKMIQADEGKIRSIGPKPTPSKADTLGVREKP